MDDSTSGDEAIESGAGSVDLATGRTNAGGGSDVDDIGLGERRRSGHPLDQGQHFHGPSLEPANHDELAAIPGEGVGVTDGAAAGKATLCRPLGFIELSGADRAHHVDGVGDEADRLDAEDLGVVSQGRVHPVRGGVTEEEQVHGAPAPTDEREHGVVGLRCGGDQLFGQSEADVSVTGPEEQVVRERQHLGVGDPVVQTPRPLDQLERRTGDPGAVRLLGSQACFETDTPRRLRRREPAECLAEQSNDVIGLDHRAVLVEPDAPTPERGVGQGGPITFGLGDRSRLTEERTRLGEASARQHRPGSLDEQGRARVGSGLDAGPDGRAENLGRSIGRTSSKQRSCPGAARLDGPGNVGDDGVAERRRWDPDPTVHDIHQTALPCRPLHLARGHAGTRGDLGQGRVATKDGDEPHDSSKRRCQPGEAVGDGGCDAPLGEQCEPTKAPTGHPHRQLDVGSGGGQPVGVEVRRDLTGVERPEADVNAYGRELADCRCPDRSGRIAGGDEHQRHRVDAVDEEAQQLDGGRTGVVHVVEHDGRRNALQEHAQLVDGCGEPPEPMRRGQLRCRAPQPTPDHRVRARPPAMATAPVCPGSTSSGRERPACRGSVIGRRARRLPSSFQSRDRR